MQVIEGYVNQLMDIRLAANAYPALKMQFQDDSDNWKMLYCQLECARRTYSKYQEKNIPDKIYIDTMKCFSRFIKECKKKNGRAYFDRGWWTYRQLSMVLFRIGELEYQLETCGKEKMVAIHIPSDADFYKDAVDCSLKLAKDFFERYYPEYAEAKYICDSWLLSPALKELLPEKSNIREFQKRFELVEEHKEDREFVEWLFQVLVDTCYEKLPEKTRLQKNVKKYLLSGGKIGSAYGVMRRDDEVFRGFSVNKG